MALTNILNTESKDSRKYKNPELKKIDFEDIAINQLNKFPLTELIDLQSQIRKDGLLNPLTVYLNADGKYTLYSGHRRLAAMLPLLRSGELPPKVNCIVINPPDDIVAEKETIYLANKNRPPLKEGELRECVFDLIEAWNMKPKEKRSGRMRDYIASYLNISPRSLQKYINEYKEINAIDDESPFTKDEQEVIAALDKQREEKKKKQQAEKRIKSALNKNGELAGQLEDYGLDLYASVCTVNGKEVSLASSLQMLEEITKEVLRLLECKKT